MAFSRQDAVEDAAPPLHQQPKEALVVVQQHQATRITRAPSDPCPLPNHYRVRFIDDEVTPIGGKWLIGWVNRNSSQIDVGDAL